MSIFEDILKKYNKHAENFNELVTSHERERRLYKLIESRGKDQDNLFKELIDHNQLTTQNLQDLFDALIRTEDLHFLPSNIALSLKIIDELSFTTLADAFRVQKSRLAPLLESDELFESLIESNKIADKDIQYLLKNIKSSYELDNFCCYSRSLEKKILKDFLLDEEIVKNFNALIEREALYFRQSGIFDVHSVFELMKFHATHYYDLDRGYFPEFSSRIDQELLKLISVNDALFRSQFSTEEKRKLCDILKNHKSAREVWSQIVENNLQDSYDFSKLRALLAKDQDKKKCRLNL